MHILGMGEALKLGTSNLVYTTEEDMFRTSLCDIAKFWEISDNILESVTAWTTVQVTTVQANIKK